MLGTVPAEGADYPKKAIAFQRRKYGLSPDFAIKDKKLKLARNGMSENCGVYLIFNLTVLVKGKEELYEIILFGDRSAAAIRKETYYEK